MEQAAGARSVLLWAGGRRELKRELNRTALLALVEGVDIKILRHRKRYRQAA